MNKLTTILGVMKDISGPEHVEILIRHDGKVVWINVDGICHLRICGMNKLVLTDER